MPPPKDAVDANSRIFVRSVSILPSSEQLIFIASMPISELIARAAVVLPQPGPPENIRFCISPESTIACRSFFKVLGRIHSSTERGRYFSTHRYCSAIKRLRCILSQMLQQSHTPRQYLRVAIEWLIYHTERFDSHPEATSSFLI